MKKLNVKLFIVTFIALAIFSSCNKDKVTQEDVIEEQQLVDLILRIVDASNSDLPVDSATVEIVDNGEVKTEVTADDGLAIFKDVEITNSVPVSVNKTDYTIVSTTLNATPASYRQAQISSTISIFPLTGNNMVTVKGRLTVETDATNREREAVPAGTMVKAYNFSLVTDLAFTATTDTNGDYEIMVPVSYEGNDDIDLVFPEIYANQTVAIEGDDYTVEVVDRPTIFNLAVNAENNAIPGLPSVYAVVEAPPAATVGSGFAVDVKAIPTALTDFDYTQAILIDGGSGYPNSSDTLLGLSVGTNGLRDSIRVEIANGSIIDILGFLDNGALYSSAPTVNTSLGSGSGAVIDILFQTEYKVYITNNGTDYLAFPKVTYNYSYYSGNQLTQNTVELTLSNYTDLANGKIINEVSSNVDTIIEFSGWGEGMASAPVFTIVDENSVPIFISFENNDISADGQIVGSFLEDAGYGYDRANPPAVTLNAVAGYGTGGLLNVVLNANGAVSNRIIINPGSGYVKNVNDFRDDGTTGDSEENPSFSIGMWIWEFDEIDNVSPGQTFIRSAHYGTGTPEIND